LALSAAQTGYIVVYENITKGRGQDKPIIQLNNETIQETQLSLTNRTTRLEVSQGYQTWYHSLC